MTARTFVENQKPSGINASYYVWSLSANWSPSGVPVNGDSVQETASVAGDAQVDDIATLTLAALSLTASATFSETLYIDTTLTVGMLTLAGAGANAPLLEATNTGGSSPTLTINAFASGAKGALLSYGDSSIIRDYAATDPGGLSYQTADFGTIVFAGALAASSKLQFLDALGDTFAFANPGATISAALSGLAAGDALEVPGTIANAVTLGGSSLSIGTDRGTYTFSNVQYAGTPPDWYGFADAANAMTLVHFSSAPDSFLSDDALSPGLFAWSDPYNWTTHVAPNAGDVSILEPAETNYYGYYFDTPAHLRQLSVGWSSGNGALGHYNYYIFLYIDSNVTIDNLVQVYEASPLALEVNPHQNGLASATLTLEGQPSFSAASAQDDNLIEAIGQGATVVVNTALAYSGTQVTFSALAGGVLDFEAPVGAGLSITTDSTPGDKVIFRSPGANVGATFLVSQNLQVELPGTKLLGLSLTSSTMAATTDLGAFTFSNVQYHSTVYGARAAYDAATGLLDLTLQATADVVSVVASGAGIVGGSGAAIAATALTLTVQLTAPVTVASLGATPPQLTLNDGGVATYSGGSGTNALTFTYTPTSGQNVAALAVTGFNANGATFNDPSALPVDMTGAVGALAGAVEIDTSPPNVTIAAPASFSSIGSTSATLTLSGSSSDNFGVTAIRLNNHLTVLASATPSANGGWTISTSLAAGDYTGLSVRALDAGGNATLAFLGGIDGDVRVASNVSATYGANKTLTLVGNNDAVSAAAGDNFAAWGSDDAFSGTGLTLSLYGAADSVTGAQSNVSLYQAQANIVGGGETVAFESGSGNVASLSNTGGLWDSVSQSNGATGQISLTSALAQISGGGDQIAFNGAGSAAHLIGTGGATDIVTFASGATGTVYLDSAQAQVTGGGQEVDFFGGSGNLATLANTGAAWDVVGAANGAKGSIKLDSAASQLWYGGQNATFDSGAGNSLDLVQTAGVWDNVYTANGAGGLTYLSSAQGQFWGGGQNVDFWTGANDAAHLLNTGAAWDVVTAGNGTTGTVYIDSALTQVWGGGDTINFWGGTGNAAELINTGANADTVGDGNGASGTVYLDNASAKVSGGAEEVAFWAGTNNVATLTGSAYTVYANAAAFGLDTVNGFGAGDSLYFASADRGKLTVTQSGGNTLVTLDASDVLTLVGYAGAVTPNYHA